MSYWEGAPSQFFFLAHSLGLVYNPERDAGVAKW